MVTYNGFSWTLLNIIAKVRAITGRPDTTMMTNQEIVNYINQYYQHVLPKELKIFFGYTYYTFFTLANVAEYTTPSNFQTLNPTVWVDGFQMDWYLWPDIFFEDYPIQDNKVVVATGAPPLNSFTFTVAAYPILPGSLYVTDGTQTAVDDGAGGFTGNATAGSIDYLTGTVTGLVFTSPPALDVNITATSQTYVPSRPQGILYYDNVFTLRNVPDDVYQVRMEGINVPTALTDDTSVPFRPDLGPLIAYGASLEIFNNFEQKAQYDKYLPDYNRYKDVSMADTYEEYLYERSVPKF